MSTAGIVFTWGEDERLAQTLLSIARRKDLGPEPFERWLGELAREGESLWKGTFSPQAYVRFRAQKAALAG